LESRPMAQSFDPIAHARHMAKLERAKAAEFRAGLVQHCPLGSPYVEFYAQACDRNADSLEAKAAVLELAQRVAA
jgi:hypothetical protein